MLCQFGTDAWINIQEIMIVTSDDDVVGNTKVVLRGGITVRVPLTVEAVLARVNECHDALGGGVLQPFKAQSQSVGVSGTGIDWSKVAPRDGVVTIEMTVPSADNPKGYIGAMVSYDSLPGEDHRRGRDLPDGQFTEATIDLIATRLKELVRLDRSHG
jgi:hypothetical protein